MESNIVYIVEDNKIYSDATAHVLRGQYNVKQFSSAESALESIDNGEIPELMILDNRMAGMTGLELCQNLKMRNIDILTIIVSGYVDAKLATAAIGLGISSVLQKPISLPDLMSALERARCTRQLRNQEKQMIQKYTEVIKLTKELLIDSETRYVQSENQLFEAGVPPYADLDQKSKFIKATLRDSRIRQEIMNCEAEIENLIFESQKTKSALSQMLSQETDGSVESETPELSKQK